VFRLGYVRILFVAHEMLAMRNEERGEGLWGGTPLSLSFAFLLLLVDQAIAMITPKPNAWFVKAVRTIRTLYGGRGRAKRTSGASETSEASEASRAWISTHAG
jgi:hypothetical protein